MECFYMFLFTVTWQEMCVELLCIRCIRSTSRSQKGNLELYFYVPNDFRSDVYTFNFLQLKSSTCPGFSNNLWLMNSFPMAPSMQDAKALKRPDDSTTPENHFGILCSLFHTVHIWQELSAYFASADFGATSFVDFFWCRESGLVREPWALARLET